jgi:cell division protein FtsL
MATAVIKKLWGARLFSRRRQERIAVAGRREILVPGLLLGIVLVGLALLHVWLRLQVVHVGYVLSTTSKVRSQLEQENRELKLELATLTSPDRLEEKARARLGLRAPEKGQVVILP